MKYDVDTVKNILENLKEDPMRVIYTEHYLDQIDRRNIPEICIEDMVDKGRLIEIREIPDQDSRFELHFRLDEICELRIIVDIFNLNSIILISALSKNNEVIDLSNNVLEFEAVYDMAFDLMDFHSKDPFRYAQSIEMEPGFNIDFDSSGQPVAIEIIRASKRFKLIPRIFSSALFDGRIEITQDLIKIRLKASFSDADRNARVFEKEIPNVYGIGENEFDLIFEKSS